MIPKILHFCVGRALTTSQQAVIQRARELHRGWDVKVWQDPVDPAGFVLSDLWGSANSGAQLADLIRLDAVYRHGGIYLDSDVSVQKSLDPLAEHFDFFIASEDGDRATNALFGASKGHPALGAIIERLRAAPPDWTQSPNLTTGPMLFARVLKWRSDVTVLPRETFYPYNWNETRRPHHRQSYGVHEWEGSWKQRGLAERVRPWMEILRPSHFAAGVLRRAAAWRQSSEFVLRYFSPRVHSYGRAGTLVRSTMHGFGIVLDGEDVTITPEIAHHGYYELREELFVRRVVKGGDWIIDVGANVGVFSLLAASRVHSFGRVFAYEPNPAVAELLSKSAVMNWMHERIVVRRAAVGATKSTGILAVTPSSLGGASIRSDDAGTGTSARTAEFISGTRELRVPVVALDDEFPCDLPIKLLKIDAEGFETNVLAGARRLLRAKCFDYVMLEVVEEVAGAGFPKVIEAIGEVCGYGYQPYVLGRNGRLRETSLAQIAAGDMPTRNVVLAAR